MLRGIGLFQAKPFMDSGDWDFPFIPEQLHDGDARGVRQSLKDAGLESAKAILH